MSIYSDGCDLCQQIHKAHEKAAESVKKKSSKVKFMRYDMYRMGGEGTMRKHLPEFADTQLPRMYFVKAGATKPIRIPHGDIGWGDKGHKTLYNWIRDNNSAQDKGFKAKAKKDAKSKEKEL